MARELWDRGEVDRIIELTPGSVCDQNCRIFRRLLPVWQWAEIQSTPMSMWHPRLVHNFPWGILFRDWMMHTTCKVECSGHSRRFTCYPRPYTLSWEIKYSLYNADLYQSSRCCTECKPSPSSQLPKIGYCLPAAVFFVSVSCKISTS
jgi:hypothetical protein